MHDLGIVQFSTRSTDSCQCKPLIPRPKFRTNAATGLDESPHVRFCLPARTQTTSPDHTMRERTENRRQRILDVLARRQSDLTIVLNNIHDPHNVSAILRSCDAFGVGEAHLLYTDTAFPQLGHKSSASAKKWVELHRHRSAKDLVTSLRSRNLQILSTGFGGNAKPLTEWDMTLPTAVILGNEHDGVAGELQDLVPDHIYIPMQGMVQSLNVSVAAAVILFEAFRQRSEKGMYDDPSLTPEVIQDTFDRWIQK